MTASIEKAERKAAQLTSLKKAAQGCQQKGKHHAAKATGIICADEAFTLDAFRDRLGTTRSGVSAMRRRGLIAQMDGGRRAMILGSAYLEFLKRQPVAELDPIEDKDESFTV